MCLGEVLGGGEGSESRAGRWDRRGRRIEGAEARAELIGVGEGGAQVS